MLLSVQEAKKITNYEEKENYFYLIQGDIVEVWTYSSYKKGDKPDYYGRIVSFPKDGLRIDRSSCFHSDIYDVPYEWIKYIKKVKEI